MKAHLVYLKYVLYHKWYVFLEAVKLGVPWLGIIHDWHKFLPSEWFPYVRYFYNPDGSYKPENAGDDTFDFAWLLHQKRGRHHWQWWILPKDDGTIKAFPIPDKYRREMLADWRGAGKAQGTPDTASWYAKNEGKMTLHPDTRKWIEAQL